MTYSSNFEAKRIKLQFLRGLQCNVKPGTFAILKMVCGDIFICNMVADNLLAASKTRISKLQLAIKRTNWIEDLRRARTRGTAVGVWKGTKDRKLEI